MEDVGNVNAKMGHLLDDVTSMPRNGSYPTGAHQIFRCLSVGEVICKCSGGRRMLDSMAHREGAWSVFAEITARARGKCLGDTSPLVGTELETFCAQCISPQSVKEIIKGRVDRTYRNRWQVHPPRPSSKWQKMCPLSRWGLRGSILASLGTRDTLRPKQKYATVGPRSAGQI